MVYTLSGCFIPLRNRQKHIINYTFVDEHIFEQINDQKWCLTNGYVANSELGRLHRYIVKPATHQVVDHLNNNKLDNTLSNLRATSQKENIMNTAGTTTGSSKYKGVHFHKAANKFRAQCGKVVIGNFKKEDHAAWAYDEYCRKNFEQPKLNNVSKPEDFETFQPRVRKTENDKNVYQVESGNWTVIICKKSHGVFKSKQDAIQHRDKILDSSKTKQTVNIVRTESGTAVRIVRKNNQNFQILVDDETYVNLATISIHLNKDGYPLLSNKKLLSRYVMDAPTGKVVDHINRNRLDNRKCNLRIVTPKENSRNRSKTANTTSKYIGVYWNEKDKKWGTSITVDKKIIYLGQFSDEITAARARDEATLKYFGYHGSLNFEKTEDNTQ